MALQASASGEARAPWRAGQAMFVAAADHSATECCHQQAAGLRRSGRYRQHARGQRRRQTFASPSRVRWSSAVDSTIELTCTGLSPTSATRPLGQTPDGDARGDARGTALSGLSGRRHGRWCRGRAPSSGRRPGVRPAPTGFFLETPHLYPPPSSTFLEWFSETQQVYKPRSRATYCCRSGVE